MGPARTGKGLGAFQFDRRFPGVGRIKKSSGTTKVKEFQRRDALLTKLYETSSLDVLRAFKAGRITIEEIVEADRGNDPALSMQRLATTQRLALAIEAALPKMGTSRETRDRYRRSLEKLLRLVPALTVQRVADLATVDWLALHDAWTQSPADWNHIRRAVSHFLTVHLGDKFHPLRRQIVSRIPAKKESPRVPDQSVESFLRLVEAMPAPARPCFMTMALTGMRVGEYINADATALRPETLSVAVSGKSGDGLVYLTAEGFALAKAAIPCPLARAVPADTPTNKKPRYRVLRRLYANAQKATGIAGLRLHDIRHLFGQTASDAGVATAQTQAALRHTDPRMTRRYEMPANARAAARAVAVQLGISKPAKKKRAS